jgi:hypothetical protein
MKDQGTAKGNKSTSKDMPVEVKGSIIKVPNKATLRSPKPSKESFEADQFRRDLLSDLNKGLGGKKTPSKKAAPEKTPKGTKPSVKKAPAKPKSKANTSQSSSRPRGGTKPMSPAQKRAKEKRVQERAKTRDELKQRQPKKDTKDRYYNTDK